MTDIVFYSEICIIAFIVVRFLPFVPQYFDMKGREA